jgi:hypothetical protein
MASVFKNPSNQPDRQDSEQDISALGTGWKSWATVNFNLCDAAGAADMIQEGKRLFGAENVMVLTVTDKRWKILVRTEDPNYMDR